MLCLKLLITFVSSVFYDPNKVVWWTAPNTWTWRIGFVWVISAIALFLISKYKSIWWLHRICFLFKSWKKTVVENSPQLHALCLCSHNGNCVVVSPARSDVRLLPFRFARFSLHSLRNTFTCKINKFACVYFQIETRRSSFVLAPSPTRSRSGSTSSESSVGPAAFSILKRHRSLNLMRDFPEEYTLAAIKSTHVSCSRLGYLCRSCLEILLRGYG